MRQCKEIIKNSFCKSNPLFLYFSLKYESSIYYGTCLKLCINCRIRLCQRLRFICNCVHLYFCKWCRIMVFIHYEMRSSAVLLYFAAGLHFRFSSVSTTMAVFSALKNKKNQRLREGIEDLASKCADEKDPGSIDVIDRFIHEYVSIDHDAGGSAVAGNGEAQHTHG